MTCARDSRHCAQVALLALVALHGPSQAYEYRELPDEAFEDVLVGAWMDCNENGVPDQFEFDHMLAGDSDRDGLLDECELVPGDVDVSGVLTLLDGDLIGRHLGAVEGVAKSFPPMADLDENHVIDAEDLVIWCRIWREQRGQMLACCDGTDNDGDGATDFPADPDCARATSEDESGADGPTAPTPPDRR